MKKVFEKAWDSKEYEEEIYKNWENQGYFKPEINMGLKSQILNRPSTTLGTGKSQINAENISYDRAIDGKPFVIPIPPPNVTGRLHIGHSLVATLQDIMIRFHRMKGEPTLWIPGTDHAGIATQSVVDKELRKKGINRHEIGRDKFVEEVWKWKEEYGGIITEQTKRMGASCDWSRERFTLDPGLSKAVNEAFVHLYEKGLIYRGEYIVNWCPKCGTAIADDEMEHEEQTAKLYYFKYDMNFPITVATTRPETKLGDSAVAVNPDDKRYREYIGKEYDIDLDGVKRKIKVIAERSIDMKFGSGAVGITPAHSAVDWKIGEANHLPVIKVIDERAKMTAEAGKYEGMKTLEAREKLVEYLKTEKLLEKEEKITNNLSVCYRCGSAIEPIPSLQWFVKMRPLAEKAKKAVEDGDVKILPRRFEKVYYQWMDNIRDWCISRQLWWGHRIPVWYKQESSDKIQETSSKQIPNSKSEIQNNLTIQPFDATQDKQFSNESVEIYVGVKPPEGEGWVQDEDVLDTWFSSALWPFSSLNWPDTENRDYKYFYPATVLETGYDILFFWVARMVMMGLELTDRAPFETVYLHGLVRDEHNRKMSKSLGNSLDPLDMIEKYGTDAVRMSLVAGTTPGQDMPVGEHKIKGFRNFSNKIWNASRFVALRVSGGDLASGELGEEKIKDLAIDPALSTEADKKILEAHEEIKKKVTKDLAEFKFSGASEALYEYFWHNFCDIYIEAAKGQLQLGVGGEEQGVHTSHHTPHTLQLSDNTKKILIKVLSESLQMLHPFVPFVTEAVWQELREIYPALAKSIMISKWPE